MLKESMVYQANITTNISGYKEKTYLGPSETIFKIHYGSHEKSFTKQPLDTELSKERLMVKKHNGIPIMKRKVLRKYHSYNHLSYA